MTDLSRSPARIAGMFDAIASRYDLLNHLLSAGLDRQWRRRAVGALGLTGRERVVDLCAGTADLSFAALDARPAARAVVGVDFSDAMLRIGLAKIRARGTRSIALVRGDATRIPLADGVAEAVTVGFGIRNVEEVDAACAEIYRVLAPGGRLAVLEFGIPRTPGIRQLYLLYFRQVLPRIGRLISRHGSAYGYLPESVRAFASPEQFVAILKQSGFPEVSARPLTLGIVYLYVARRP